MRTAARSPAASCARCAPRASPASPCITTRTVPRRTCGWRTRLCHWTRRFRPPRTWIRRRSSKRHGTPAPTRSIPATAFCPRTPRSPSASPSAGLTFVGPDAADHPAHGRQDPRARVCRANTACRWPRASSKRSPARLAARAAEIGFPLLDQGGGRRWRQGHAHRAQRGGAGREPARRRRRGAALLRRRTRLR